MNIQLFYWVDSKKLAMRSHPYVVSRFFWSYIFASGDRLETPRAVVIYVLHINSKLYKLWLAAWPAMFAVFVMCFSV